MHQQYALDSELHAMLESLRQPTESIWNLEFDLNNIAKVLLITDPARQQANRMTEIGLAGGEGRVLEFQKLQGAWSLTGTTNWIA